MRRTLRHKQLVVRAPPTVSLYIPACNAAETLGPCLRALAGQTTRADEVIVVDDGSVDRTAEIAERMGVTLIRHRRNRGVAAARNTAVRAAHGDLIASVDADLVVPRDWLKRMRAAFRRRRRIVGCCGRVIEKYTSSVADRWRATHMQLSFGRRRCYKPRWLFCGNSLIRRDALLEVGLFDERCVSAYEDVDLSDRLRGRGHTLLYDPTVVATHLKRSTPADVVRGFWNYWAAKNEMEGAYDSLATARRLMMRRQMGITAYRMATDIRHRRYELLPLDLLIPLTFCVRDLEKMVQLKALRRAELRAICRRMADESLGRCRQHLSLTPPPGWAALAFANGVAPNGRVVRPDAKGAAYLRTFSREFDRLLANISRHVRLRIVEHLPAVLNEARADGFVTI